MTESRVQLWEDEAKTLVDAALFDEVTDLHLAAWNNTWRPALEAYCAAHGVSNRPEDSHWDWKCKASEWRPLLGYHSFAVVCKGELQGLMLASDFKSARLSVQFGKATVYVEFLASAPWNRAEVQRPKRYSGVGTVMVAAAIGLSIELGYRGRVGLHSLPRAERFYRDICGMSELGKDTAHQNLMYYEMTESQADAFRKDT